MSETKKFTQEEMNEISKLREDTQSKVLDFGQLKFTLIVIQMN